MTYDMDNDPEFLEWKKRVETELIPKLDASAVSLSIVPAGKADVKYAVELGLSIMMDKPIILVVSPGTHVPSKLALIADDIIAVDWLGSQAKIGKAIAESVKRLMKEKGL